MGFPQDKMAVCFRDIPSGAPFISLLIDSNFSVCPNDQAGYVEDVMKGRIKKTMITWGGIILV